MIYALIILLGTVFALTGCASLDTQGYESSRHSDLGHVTCVQESPTVTKCTQH